MTPVTVACVWVQGNVPYSSDYVSRLQAGVRRHLRRPHTFVCLTDQPWALRDVATIPIQGPGDLPGWWSKVKLFDHTLGWSGRVLYLDLDSLVVGDLDPLLDFDASFALLPHGGSFQGRAGLKVVPRFNSSVMVWDAGAWAPSDLWTDWTPGVARRLWGDQDWIGERYPHAATLPGTWCPRLSDITAAGGPPFASETRVILSKKPKNHVAAAQYPWFDVLWRAA